MDNELPLISVIILNYNGKGFVEDCVDSVLKSDYQKLEVIIVDNASTDNSLAMIEEKFCSDRRIKIIRNKKNLLFTGGNNMGIKEAEGEFIVILNNDTVVRKSWLREIVSAMQDPTIGAAQPKIYIYDTNPLKIDYCGGSLDKYGYASGLGCQEIDTGQCDNVKDIFYAGGTAMILRKRALDEVGLFDEKFGMHWEDTDLSWRIRLKGYRIALIPKSIVYHKGSRTMTKFAERPDVAWHIRKNRIAGLIKNYHMSSMLKFMPVLVLIYFMVFVKELVVDRNIKLAASSIFAIIWNIKELPYLLNKRKIVQKQIRVIPDSEIIKNMQAKSVLIEQYFRPFFTKHKNGAR